MWWCVLWWQELTTLVAQMQSSSQELTKVHMVNDKSPMIEIEVAILATQMQSSLSVLIKVFLVTIKNPDMIWFIKKLMEQCILRVHWLIFWSQGVNELRAMYVIEAGEEVTYFSVIISLIWSETVLFQVHYLLSHHHYFRWPSTTSPWLRRAGRWGRSGRSTSGIKEG